MERAALRDAEEFLLQHPPPVLSRGERDQLRQWLPPLCRKIVIPGYVFSLARTEGERELVLRRALMFARCTF
ncbi:MAG: hypothetical protein ACYTKD_20580 [Planctomycetota bacterium]